MPKIIYVCSKNRLPFSIEKQLKEICKNISPDNLEPTDSKIHINNKIAYGVMNPTNSMLAVANSLLVGKLIGTDHRWLDPFYDQIDGSYALFRDSDDHLEIVADPVASKTIWHYMDDDVFVASTSQRAIIMLLGSFEFEERVVPWMLSTGSLGPSLSWDRRMCQVPPDSSIVLNKKNWTIHNKTKPIEFTPYEQSDNKHKNFLLKSIENTFKSLDFDFSEWVLPLSGGYDSRAILYFLLNTNRNTKDLRTITWGLKSSLENMNNDAYVAKKLSNSMRVSHNYYYTDIAEDPISAIDRFVLLGEGRTDLLHAYMDGFKIWKTLFKEGVRGIIRGDEGFGWECAPSVKLAKYSLGCALCSDYSNLKDYREYGFSLQELPDNLVQKDEETLPLWRDRLYHEYRMPTILSSLSDLKLSYVELVNPLLSRKILKQVRLLPDHLRTDKALFKKIVRPFFPNVEFASGSATASTKNILFQKKIVRFLAEEINSNSASHIIPKDFVKKIQNGIRFFDSDQENNKKSFSESLLAFPKKVIPKYLKDIVKDKMVLPTLDSNLLAFRVFLISKMNRILRNDSRRL